MAKILLIEDDELVLRMYRKALEQSGYEVVVAKNGQEGISAAHEHLPQFILCDVMMPEMNGLDVLRALKSDSQTQSIPIVMLTNLSGTHDAETAKELGALDYLVKSEHRPREIVEKVKTYLGI